jgi:hypothetical protein
VSIARETRWRGVEQATDRARIGQEGGGTATENHTHFSFSLRVTPQRSDKVATICMPRPWVSLGGGLRNTGFPGASSTTSTRTQASDAGGMTRTSNAVAPWLQALVASSDTIKMMSSVVSGTTEPSTPAVKRRAWQTEVGSQGNRRRYTLSHYPNEARLMSEQKKSLNPRAASETLIGGRVHAKAATRLLSVSLPLDPLQRDLYDR